METEDLKRKVERLIEQSTQHTQQISGLTPLTERVDLAENQIIKWRHRVPDLTDDEDDRTIVTAVEVKEQLRDFKDVTRRGFQEIRRETRSLSEKIDILQGARSETWELVSQQLNITLDRRELTVRENART